MERVTFMFWADPPHQRELVHVGVHLVDVGSIHHHTNTSLSGELTRNKYEEIMNVLGKELISPLLLKLD